MDPATIVAAVLIGGGGVIAVGGSALLARFAGRRKREERLSLFQTLAQRTGLVYSPPDIFGNGAGLFGRLDGLSVTVEAAREIGKLVVDVHGGVPEELLVACRSTEDEQYVPPEDRIDTGDPEIGGPAIVAGDEAVVLACLGHSVRAALASLLADDGIRIEHGHLIRRFPPAEAAKVEILLAGAVSLAKRIEEARPPDGLATNVANDPLPDVRARNLEVLLVRFPDDPATAHAVNAALKDPDERIRLAAELWSDASRAAVFSSRTAQQVADAVLAFEGTLQEPLVRRIARSDGAAEELLLILSHRYAEDTSRFPMLFGTSRNALARAALEGLGEIGTVRSVEPLLALSRGGLLADPAVASKATEAIARIQSRLRGAGAGQLAISGSAGDGALSVSGSAGALSDADPEKPRT